MQLDMSITKEVHHQGEVVSFDLLGDVCLTSLAGVRGRRGGGRLQHTAPCLSLHHRVIDMYKQESGIISRAVSQLLHHHRKL